ncbi:metallophosphoesterase, partial [Patescibacteria group bacterium]|nr:metallophosphoesterase [Patescibacteria group bacterium]
KNINNKNIDLVLVGHTHGAMMNIPFLWKLYIPLEYDKQYKNGLFYENNIYMYVSRGIGTSFLPIRFNSLPEIAILELKIFY